MHATILPRELTKQLKNNNKTPPWSTSRPSELQTRPRKIQGYRCVAHTLLSWLLYALYYWSSVRYDFTTSSTRADLVVTTSS
jgi:hypothetical protein